MVEALESSKGLDVNGVKGCFVGIVVRSVGQSVSELQTDKGDKVRKEKWKSDGMKVNVRDNRSRLTEHRIMPSAAAVLRLSVAKATVIFTLTTMAINK